jgi:hypothetical protein
MLVTQQYLGTVQALLEVLTSRREPNRSFAGASHS